MNSFKLLDCTVRDGGYLNDWKFGAESLTEIVQRLINANVDYVELGFIDDRRPFDKDRSIFPNTEAINEVYKHIKRNNHTKFIAMIDFGTCDIRNISKKEDSILDGIRVIFKKEKMEKALQYCAKIKALGYELFTQLVSATVYEDEDFDRLSKIENELKPTAVGIVDTYGLMDFKRLEHIFHSLDIRLDKSIKIGYHAHNNLQLAFSNAMQYLAINANRDVIVDGTLMGMGKSAGNAPIELLAVHCNRYYKTQYNVDALLEAIDSNIIKLYGKNHWGYSMKFLLSSINEVHPNYVNDYISKNLLSISSINSLLATLEGDVKLLYNKSESENKYLEYCQKYFNDTMSIDVLKKELSSKPVLLIGPGKSIDAAKTKIKKLIKEINPIIISVNVNKKGIIPNYLFLSNSRRLDLLANEFDELYSNNVKIIGTTNLSPYFKPFYLSFNYESLLDQESFAKDSAIVMILKLLTKCECKRVYLAGFDGYASFFEDDFVNLSNSYGWQEPYPGFLNSYIRNKIKEMRTKTEVKFVTASLFEEEE